MKILRNICLIVLAAGVILCAGGAIAGGTMYTGIRHGVLYTWQDLVNAGRSFIWHNGFDFSHNFYDWLDIDDWFEDTPGHHWDGGVEDFLDGLNTFPLPDHGQIHSLMLDVPDTHPHA